MKEKKKKEMSCCEKVFIVVILVIFVSTIFFYITLTGRDAVDIRLNQETADDVCRQLTGNPTAIASDEIVEIYDGKLICTVPSFDSTQNIIVKGNG